jgi:hypothetical protein
MDLNTETVYVQLLNEGTVVYRPTHAIILEEGTYRLLATPDYDPDDEIWEYLPNTIVVCKPQIFADGETCLVVCGIAIVN